MNIRFTFGLVTLGLVILGTMRSAEAQTPYTLSLLRADAFNDGQPDLSVGRNTAFVQDQLSATDFSTTDNQLVPDDFDDNLPTTSSQSLVTTPLRSARAEVTGRVDCLTAIGNSDFVGALDSLSTGELDVGPTTLPGWGGAASWSISTHGDAEFIIMPTAGKPTPTTINLRANLWAVAVGGNTGPSPQINAGTMTVEIANLRTGDTVSFFAQYNNANQVWDFMTVDPNFNVTTGSAAELNEVFYVENANVLLNDRIRVSVHIDMTGASPMDFGHFQQLWELKGSPWFDVIAQ